MLIGVGAVVLVLLLMRVRFCYEAELPDPPSVAAAGPAAVVGDPRQFSHDLATNADVYGQYLKLDAETHRLRTVPGIKEMSVAFPYQVESRRRTLSPSQPSTEVLGLRLSISVDDIPGAAGAGAGAKQMVLKIQNLRDRHLAYRVKTRPTRGLRACGRKREIAHNAVAIRPRGTEIRSECLFQPGQELEIELVETIEIPELSFAYLSALPSLSLGLDPRVARSHRVEAAGTRCATTLPANVQRAMDRGELGWRDLIDFYARHRCQTYQFPIGYRAFQRDGERALPVASEQY